MTVSGVAWALWVSTFVSEPGLNAGRLNAAGVDCYQQFVVGLYAAEVVACLHCAVSHGRYVGEIGQYCLLRGARGQRNHAKQREKQIGTVHYMLHANLTNHSFNNVANL